MSHYGVLNDYTFKDIEDVRGADVYGVNDEKLGTISDIIFDHSTGEIRYAVIDSGGWLSSKKFLVRINRLQPYGTHADKFYANLDKERIKMLPEYHPEILKSEERWTDYEKRYSERLSDGQILYNRETGRVVTPPIQEVEGGRTQPLSEEGKRSLMRDFTPEKVGQQDDLLGVASSGDDVTLKPKKASIAGREDVLLQEEDKKKRSLETAHHPGLQEPGVYRLDTVPEAEKRSDLNEPLNAHYGQRWTHLQEKLRADRDKVVGNCPLCGTQKKVA